MPKIRAILFDLDNTLVDFIRMKEESCRAAVKAMVASGLQMDEDQAFELLLIKYFDCVPSKQHHLLFAVSNRIQVFL